MKYKEYILWNYAQRSSKNIIELNIVRQTWFVRNLKRQNKQSNNIIHCILKQASLRHFSAVIFCVPEIMNDYIETCTSQKVIDNSIQNFSVLSETLILYQYFLNVRKKQLNSLLSNGLTTGAKAIEFIISILKSLAIPVIWLALSSVIYSRITLSVLNRIIHVLIHIISVLNRTNFCSILHHFCFGYKMRFKSLFVSAFQQTSYLFK